jgi:hypothetical protein
LKPIPAWARLPRIQPGQSGVNRRRPCPAAVSDR